MKEIDDLINIINQDKERLKCFLQSQCGVDISAMEKKRKQELFQNEISIHSLKELRVAAIMDRFTYESYSPECTLLEITSENWEEELVEFKPHLLFVESVWEGKDKTWYRKVSKVSREYSELVNYCRKHNIPVIFWNKEDPVWTDTFMDAASFADYIFTTDVDCIKRYKTELDNDNVFFLHFAAQPQIHNPIEKYDRKDKFCFAGAYYHRYPERAQTFDEFAKVFVESKGLDIYDRNYGNSRPEHAFPDTYSSMILGKLAPGEIDKAYKGYYYGVNMNSVNQSQTMFARRVFEMLASNTVTVGNYACGLRKMFGDLTICTNSGKTLKEQLTCYCGNDIDYRKYRLAGLRKALQAHLYEDRLDYIVQKVYGVSLKRKLPKVLIYAYINAEKDMNRLQEMFDSQTYDNKEIVFVTSEKFRGDDIRLANIITWEDALQKTIILPDGYIAYWSVDDYYGKNYLLDMVLTLRYMNADVIGKKCYYECVDDSVMLQEEKRYMHCTDLDIRSSICAGSLLSEWKVTDLFQNNKYHFNHQFCIDEFNYCRKSGVLYVDMVDDIAILDEGIEFEQLIEFAEHIQKEKEAKEVKKLKIDQLLGSHKLNSKAKIEFRIFGKKLQVNSNMPSDTHEYVYFPHLCNIDEEWRKKEAGFKLVCNGSLDMTAVCILLDEHKQRIDAVTGMSGRILKLPIDCNVRYLKFGIRPRGEGKSLIDSVIVGDFSDFCSEEEYIFDSDIAILTNHYPSEQDLYRNMFVHKRAMMYKDNGVSCNIIRVNRYVPKRKREFQGINIIEGSSEVLRAALEIGQLKTILIHFLDCDMWEVLKNYLSKIRIIIWSHGADIQPWFRRSFLYKTEDEIEKAKKETRKKEDLWKEVFLASETNDIHFIYVSEYLANTVMEDYGYQLPKEKYSVIHNYIDNNMFLYVPKNEEQRKRIISIRPYASSSYANDIMAKAIIELANRDFFEELEFLIIGDGILFDEITEPLRKYKNVILRKTFLCQEEIAELYKEYGIVLIPSRGDTQGVSRDEAMVAGLVPIASKVMAVPEFVDENCGFLADYEDYMAMADYIEFLYKNQEQFKIMSKNAHEQVLKLSGYVKTIKRELNVLDEYTK